MDISQLDLSRLQFATTTIYHFIFVPVTIGLAFLVAILHTQWYRSGDPTHRRLTRFFGTLLVVNIAIGVVTGLVQEFEFGMNWSQYSRFVGDVFGAPLAMEGLAAFFLESTFLGLWLFGWSVLPRKVHLATAWLVFAGATLSAAFIMAANSWMQHPVGYEINETTGRAQLTSISAIFTNPVFVWGYAHVLLASLVTGSMVMLAVSAWQLRKGAEADRSAFSGTTKLALAVLLPVSIGQVIVGSHLGVIETTYQPMKVAAMEAQWDSCAPCSFSVVQVGGGNNDQNPTKIIQIPHLLSILATSSWDGPVTGINELQAQYEQEFGPGNYIPNVFIQYWSMRVMAYPAGARAGARPVGGLAVAAQDVGALEAVPVGVDLGGVHPVHHEHCWLVAHRERATALDRSGPHAHPGRELALGQRDGGRHQPRGLRAALHRAGDRVDVSDAPLREA